MLQNSQNDTFKRILGVVHSMTLAICAGIIIAAISIYFYKNNFEHKNIIVIDNDISQLYSVDDTIDIKTLPAGYIATASKKNISAKAYIVANLSTDQIILKRNEEQLLPIASITKLITAIIANSLMYPDSYIVLSQRFLDTYGNEARFRLNEKLRVRELLYPLLMVSSNDAAEALAGSYSKGRQSFIKEMNKFSSSIGAYKTYFTDPSGLSSQNLSTAKDLLIITKWIVDNNPEIFNITLSKNHTVRFHTWTNPTHLLNLSAYIGGKNGYTVEANRTSISLFSLGKDKKQIIAVIVLGSSRRDSDVLDLLEEAIR
jgi:D-alanyl-D-alanine carboxypeptidase